MKLNLIKKYYNLLIKYNTQKFVLLKIYKINNRKN